MIQLKKLKEIDAIALCEWQYPGEYAVYNLRSWAYHKEHNIGIANPKIRDKAYRGIYLDNNLLGYIHFYYSKNQELMFGIGIRTEDCNKGYSREIMPIVFDYVDKYYPKQTLYLIVRSFNQRAQKAYEYCGFRKIDELVFETPTGKDTFIKMKKIINS